jgi:hypothetical protein
MHNPVTVVDRAAAQMVWTIDGAAGIASPGARARAVRTRRAAGGPPPRRRALAESPASRGRAPLVGAFASGARA